jgi:hypothetical protein
LWIVADGLHEIGALQRGRHVVHRQPGGEHPARSSTTSISRVSLASTPTWPRRTRARAPAESRRSRSRAARRRKDRP